jgi:hypothetical protein
MANAGTIEIIRLEQPLTLGHYALDRWRLGRCFDGSTKTVATSSSRIASGAVQAWLPADRYAQQRHVGLVLTVDQQLLRVDGRSDRATSFSAAANASVSPSQARPC